tara:strand:- start:1321 stop:2103 length:783 start_codon:yes stop_codon:yes gene_type:complete
MKTKKTKKTKILVETETPSNWEIKDRNYYLLGGKSPLTFTLASKNMMHFDESLGYSREIRYAPNQRSIFVDEQEGYVTLKHIVFKDGTLFVPRTNQPLQKLLSIYHPQLNKTYQELDPVKEAVSELDTIELELEALNLAKDLDIDHAEAVLRVEVGSSVGNMTTSEIKRDLLLFAKKSPETFIALVNDDNIVLRNLAIRATETGIISLDDDQRTFKWGSNKAKLMTVPFDENPYSAMGAWFKTDEGTQVQKSIEKKLKIK